MKFKAPLPFWVLSGFLLLVFLTGGSSRADVLSLAILMPASIIACGVGCSTLQRDQARGKKFLFVTLFAAFLLGVLHLIPLPPEIWQRFGGRQNIIAIDEIAGLGNSWRSLTVTPTNGWHSFFFLFLPLTIVVLGVQLDRTNIYRLLWVVLGLSLLSGGVGILQAVGSESSPAYFYRISDRDNSVGLFANRNHAAILLACVFPMLAAAASVDITNSTANKQRQILVVSIALVLIPLILVTGSRSGLVASVIGLSGAALLYKRPGQGRVSDSQSSRSIKRIMQFLPGVIMICVVSATYFFSRAKAVDRIFEEARDTDSRIEFWLVSIDLLKNYKLWGSGAGSFPDVYLAVEPQALLDPTYLNRAHNDWLEIAITFGLPGILLLSGAALLYSKCSFQIWRSKSNVGSSLIYARMAAVSIAILAVASVSDYPLRTPIMICVLMTFILWIWPSKKPAVATEHYRNVKKLSDN